MRRLAVPVVLLVLAAPPAAAAGWRWPVRGDVLAPFRVARDPFAAGQHRGVELAARAGEPVRAACGGRVAFAGRTPEHAVGVTIACGALRATHLGLRRAHVRPGTSVPPGRVIGVAAGPSVHLGARRRGARLGGYVDPLALIDDEGHPLGPAPAPAARRRPPSPAPPPPARPAPRPLPGRAPDAVPSLAWAGLALVAAGAPAHALVRRRRRGRRAARAAREAVQASG